MGATLSQYYSHSLIFIIIIKDCWVFLELKSRVLEGWCHAMLQSWDIRIFQFCPLRCIVGQNRKWNIVTEHISNIPVLIQVYMTFRRVLHMTTYYYGPYVSQHVPCDDPYNSHVMCHVESCYSAQASHLKLKLQPVQPSCIVNRLSVAFLGTAKMSKCWHIRGGAGIRYIWQHITWFTHILTNVWQLLNEWESWHFLFLDNQCSPKKRVFICGNRTADLQRLFEKQSSKHMM